MLLMGTKAAVRYFKVTSGFRLAGFLGYCAAVSGDSDLYIISSDKGYGCLKSFREKTMNSPFKVYYYDSVYKAAVSTYAIAMPNRLTETVITGHTQGIPALSGNADTSPIQITTLAEDEDSGSLAAAPGILEVSGSKETPDDDTTPSRKNEDTADERLLSLIGLPDINTEECIGKIKNLVKKSGNKQQFYTGMTKEFGMEKGVKIYRILCPEYLNLKKICK